MDWPPQSPDLNIIEPMWDHLKEEVSRMARTSKDSLWTSLQKAWSCINKNVLRKYLKSMPKRCQAVIDANGGPTRY